MAPNESMPWGPTVSLRMHLYERRFKAMAFLGLLGVDQKDVHAWNQGWEMIPGVVRGGDLGGWTCVSLPRVSPGIY